MGLSPDLRQLAGLVIKNYTFPQLPRLPLAVQQMLKQEMLHALSDTQSDIRNTAGILIGRISESFLIETWADLLPPLYLMLDYKQHGSLSLVDGALQVHHTKRHAMSTPNSDLFPSRFPSLIFRRPRTIFLP
jgi:hypothetical protein